MRTGWYPSRIYFLFVCKALKYAITAYTQALGTQRGTEGHSGHAADPEPQGPRQTAYANKGWFSRALSPAVPTESSTISQMSEDQSALRQMMRLRGFSLMTNIMDDYEKDLEVLMLVCVLDLFLFLIGFSGMC